MKLLQERILGEGPQPREEGDRGKRVGWSLFLQPGIPSVAVSGFILVVVVAWGVLAKPSTLVSNASSTPCGGPLAYCSRTNLALVPLPNPIPNVGNLSGAGTIIVDPDFGNRILRVTDARTRPDPAVRNSYDTGSSAETNIWSLDSRKFVVEDSGTWKIPFNFDPARMQATRMYVADFPSTDGMLLSDVREGIGWSHINPNILYAISPHGPSLVSYDFSDSRHPPRQVTVKRWTDPGCLNGIGPRVGWVSELSLSNDDRRFAISFSTGIQNTAVWIGVYDRMRGCRWYNTSTGQIGGDWGPPGTATISERYPIHNLQISQNGDWVRITPGGCISGGCGNEGFLALWQISTLNVATCYSGSPNHCAGHQVNGFTHWINNSTESDQRTIDIRPFSSLGAFSQLTENYPKPRIGSGDMHLSWNNNNSTDAVPVCAHLGQLNNKILRAWDWEIVCFATDRSGKAWRFAHSFSTGQDSWYTNDLGNVSQDGKWFLFTSDWQFTLGSITNNPVCSPPDCRNDVFIVELK